MWDSSRIHRYLVSWKEIILTAATTTRRSIAVVNEVGPPLLCLHPSIAVGGFGNLERLPLDGGTSGGPVSLHNAIWASRTRNRCARIIATSQTSPQYVRDVLYLTAAPKASIIAVDPPSRSRSARRTPGRPGPPPQRARSPSLRSAPRGCAPRLAAGVPLSSRTPARSD